MDVSVPVASLSRRTMSGLVSQGLSSLSNFALVIIVARLTTPSEFGGFAVGYSIALVVLVTLRAAIGDTLAVTETDRGSTRSASGAVTLLAAAVGACMIGSGLLVASPLGEWLVLFGLALPVVGCQDALRSAGFARHRPSLSAASDGVWLAVQVFGWGLLALLGALSPTTAFLAWVLGAGLGMVVVARDVGWPFVGGAYEWLGRHKSVVTGLSADAVLATGAPQVTLYSLGIVVGLPAAGALRGAMSLYGPATAFLGGIGAVGLPEARSRAQRDIRALRRYSLYLSAATSVVALVATVILSTLPDAIGRRLLGATWPLAADVLPPIGILVVGTCAYTGVRLGLRVLHATPQLLMLRSYATLATIVLGVGGALLGGVSAAAFGLAFAEVSTAVLGWVLFYRATSFASHPGHREA